MFLCFTSTKMLISNQRQETILLTRLVQHLSGTDTDTVTLVSNDGVKFTVSRLAFCFFSNYCPSNSFDVVLCPIGVEDLSTIVEALNLKKYKKLDKDVASKLQLLGLDPITLNDFILKYNSQEQTKISQQKTKSENVEENVNKGIEIGEILSEEMLDDSEHHNSKIAIMESVEYDIIENNSTHSKSNVSDTVVTSLKVSYEDTTNCSKVSKKRYKTKKNVNKSIMIENTKNKRCYKNKAVTEWVEVNGKRKLKSLKCKICDKFYSKTDAIKIVNLLKNFRQHYKSHEESTKNCSKCDIHFDTNAELVYHDRIIHRSGVKCIECSDVLANEENLRIHREKIHRKIFECNLCSYEITGHSAENKFKKHCLSHETVEEKNRLRSLGEKEISCPEEGCTMIFHRPGDLNHHIKRKHTLKTCPECGVEVKILYAHMNKKHQKDSDKPIRCDKCGKGFSQQNELKRHVEKAHLDVKFHCRFPNCLKKEQPYTDSSNRNAHERKEHGGNYSQFKKMFMSGHSEANE